MVLTRAMARARRAATSSLVQQAGRTFVKTATVAAAKQLVSAVKGRIGGGKRRYGRKRKGKSKKQAMKSKVKTLAKAVGKELGIAPVIGKYYKSYSGQLLPVSTGNVNWKVGDAMYRRQGSTTNPVRDLHFFRIHDFVDAASVLFNGKVEAAESNLGTGDFTDSELHFMVKYASVKVMFKNCCDQPMELQVIVASPKDLEDDSFLIDWDDQFTNLNVVGTSIPLPQPHNWNTEPGHVDGLRKRWAFKTKNIILQPGEVHYVQRKLKDFEFKLIDYYDQTNVKKFGKMSQLISYRYNVLPTFHYASTGDKLLTGRATVGGDPATLQSAVTGMLVEVNETWIVHAPDIAAVANKKDTICYMNDYDISGTLVNKSKVLTKIFSETDNPVVGYT